jgi:hypothetical protein
MTILIIIGVLVALLVGGGAAWWSSGRAKPLPRRQDPQWSATEADHVARSQGGGHGLGSII